MSTVSAELFVVASARSGSATLIVVEDTVVVVPDTVKFPDNTTLPEKVCPPSASDFNSLALTLFAAIFVASIALSCIFAVATELPANCAVLIKPSVIKSTLLIALAAICLATIASLTIFPEVTLLSAILAVVTCNAPICIVSILPVTNSDESTEFAASSEEPTTPAAICDASITSVPILLAFIALFAMFGPVTVNPAILAPVTASSAKCIVSILPVTNSALSTELAAICLATIQLLLLSH